MREYFVYFPFFKPQSGGKRFAAQPQTIYSEFPKEKKGGILMCLSTVYRNSVTPDEIIMKNVMTIEQKDGVILLTDLMERQVAVEGTLEKANLVDGYVVIKEKKTA